MCEVDSYTFTSAGGSNSRRRGSWLRLCALSDRQIDRRAEAERDAPQKFKIHPYFPDLVLVYRDPDNPDIGIVITIESQDKPDHRKRWQIPVCQAILADKHELETWPVVVVSRCKPADLMRSWAVGPPPKVDALVLAVDNVPRVTSLEQARLRPTMTALSAALHGCNGDLECVRVAIAVVSGTAGDAATALYLDGARGLARARVRNSSKESCTTWKTRIHCGRSKTRSGLLGPLYRKASARGARGGSSEDAARGLVRRLVQRRIQGLCGREIEEARQTTLVEMIFALLEVREIEVDEETARTGTRVRQPHELEHWARRAREVEVAS